MERLPEDGALTVFDATEHVTGKSRGCRMGICAKALLPGVFFLLLGVSGVVADDKTEQEETTTLVDITVTEETGGTPVTPVNTRYGSHYNVVTEEQIKEQNSYDFQSTLRNVPGVMFQSKNLMGSQTSHSLYIRGRGASHPSADFAIQFDGAPRYGALFGQVLGDSIAVSTIGGIEIFKSPQPSEFGSGYASVNVLPRYLKQDGRELVVDFSGGSHSTFDQSISGGMKEGRYDFYMSGSWTSTDGHEEHSRAQQGNGYANLGYQINDEWNIRFLANAVSSQTLAPRPETAPTGTNAVSWPGAERYDTETLFSTVTLNHDYEHLGGYLKAYWNETDFDLLQELTGGNRYAAGTGGLWSRQEIRLLGIRAKEKLRLWTGGEISLGADLDKTELKNTQRTYSGLAVAGINGGLAERVWAYPDTTLISPHAAVSQLVGEQEGFHAIPSAGVRYYSHNEFKDKTAPHAGMVLGYGRTDITFNYSRGVNYPSAVSVMNAVVTNSTVTDPAEYWKELKPEVVDHYEVGITQSFRETASFGATVFRDKGKDRFQTYMFGVIPTQFNDPIGTYEIEGFELTGSVKPVKNLECFASATWMDVEATGSDGVTRDEMPYTPGFQFQAGITWKFLEKFKLYVDMQHLKDVYQGTIRRSGTLDYGSLSESSKLDDVTLFNGRIGYSFDCIPLRIKDSEIFLAVNNIFGQDYEYAKGYTMPGTTVFAGYSIKFH